MALIELKNVGLSFPVYGSENRHLKRKILDFVTLGKISGGNEPVKNVKALQNCSIKIVDGERVGVIGCNGSGKSTLLRLLSGIYKPTEGILQIDGTISSLLNISLGTDNESTGIENLYLRSILLGLDNKIINKNMEEMIRFTELGEFINYPLKTYSSGMRMRVAFAASTQFPKDILLLDEWLSVGDKDFQSKAEARLVSLINESKILVLASHSRRLIEKVCTRVIWLEKGKIKMDDEPKKVCASYFS